MNNLTKIAPILFLLIWSFGAIFTKLGLEFSSIWSFLFLRSSIALILLFLIYFFYTRSNNIIYKKSEIYQIVITGFFLQVLYLLFYFYAIKTQLSLGIIILVLGTQPILTMLINIKSLNLQKISLAIISFVGLIITISSYHGAGSYNFFGILFATLSLFSITIGTYLQSKIASNLLITLLIQTSLSWLIYTILVIYHGFIVSWNLYFILSLFWMGCIVSVFAFLLLNFMLSKNSVENVSMLFFLLPIVTIIFEVLIFKTKFTTPSILGVLIVSISVYLYQVRYK